MMIKILGLLIVLIAPLGVFGGAIEIPDSWKESESSSGSSSGQSSPPRRDSTVSTVGSTGTVTTPCDKNEYRGKEVSLGFLDRITQKMHYDDNVSIDKNGNLEGNLYLENYISACFIPSIHTVKRGDKIFVKIENIYFNRKEGLSPQVKEIADQDISIDDKYSQCLKAKGLIKDKDGKKVLDIEKIKRDGLISFATLPYVNAESEGGGVPLKLNKDRSYQLYFSSNGASGYKGFQEKRIPASNAPRWGECMVYHQWSKDKPFYEGRLDSLKKDIIDICNGNDPRKKIKAVLSLRNSPFLSSFGVLAGAVDDILISNLAKEQNKIFEGEGEDDLANIEERMKKLVLESRKNLDKGIVDKDLEFDAKKLSKEYQKILADINSQVHDPTKKLIEKLHEEYDNARSENERVQIEERLDKLSEIMGGFSEGKKDESCRKMPCGFYKQFYIYEGKERFKKDGEKFEKLRLSSAHWSKSSKGGRGSLSIPSVHRKIKVGMRRFNRRAKSWKGKRPFLKETLLQSGHRTGGFKRYTNGPKSFIRKARTKI